MNSTVLTFSGIDNFTDNSADYDGAIYSGNSTLTFTGTSIFTNNLANHIPKQLSRIWWCILHTYSTLTFTGINIFIRNSANHVSGGFYALQNTVLSFNGSNNFISNSAASGGAIYMHRSQYFSQFQWKQQLQQFGITQWWCNLHKL